MKRVKTVFMIAVALLTIQTAIAHSNPRIKHGVKTGQLTPKEARMLRVQKAHVHSLKHLARADGRVTPREKVIINRAQRNFNRNIYYQKHDRNTRRVCR